MHASAWPEELEVEPGEAASFSVTVTNTSNVIDAYRVQVFGIDSKWVTTTPSRLSLFPGDVDTMTVSIALPVDYPASRRRLALTVRSENDSEDFALTHAEIGVTATSQLDVSVEPSMMQGGRRGRFGILVANTGNATVSAVPIAVDPEDLAEFEFSPPTIDVPAGQSRVVQVTAHGGRAWLGNPRARTFTLGIDADERIERPATFIQRPRIGRWLISFLGLLAAAAVFALVLSIAFSGVIDEASIDDSILEGALDDGEGKGVQIPVNPVTLTGSVVSQTTGTGVPAIQAELFAADDTTVAKKSVVTDDNGVYTFSGLASGTYKIRLTGSGFNPVWYKEGLTAAGAEEMTVEIGNEYDPLDPIVIGGRPGSISGLVIAADPSGAIATLLVDGQIDATVSAIVAQVDVSADGTFVFEAVPSPAVYRLRVEKIGFAVDTRSVPLEAGQSLSGVEVVLRADDGVIGGVVTDASGRLGGVTVVATDGTNTIETVSLTEDDPDTLDRDERGTYAVRNLAVPGRYTLTFSTPGYATESRTVPLDDGATVRQNENVSMSSAVGSISGVTTDATDNLLTGVTVAVVGADFDVSTTSYSQAGTEGRFFVDAIPIPGSYTLTFSKPGFASRVLLVELDSRLGTANTDVLRVALTKGTAVVRGVVTDLAGQPLSGVAVTLSGNKTYRQISADLNPGAYAFTGLDPGSYTLRASRDGSRDVVIPITLQPGTERFEPLRMGEQAAIVGRVILGTPAGGASEPPQPAVGKTVRLFRSADFPAGPTVGADQVTDADGNFTFSGIEADVVYLVAVYSEPNAPNEAVLDSIQVTSQEASRIPIDRALVVGVVG